MDPRSVLMAAVAGLVLLMFAIVHGLAIARSLKPTLAGQIGTDPDPNDPLSYSCTVLAGLVVGIVALFFGVDPAILYLPASWVELAKLAYVVVYLGAGLVAWGVWIARNGDILVPVRNLALSFLGVVIPVVALFMNDASSMTG